MTKKFQDGKKLVTTKATIGWKRFKAFTAAVTLSTVSIYSGLNAYNQVQAGDKDFMTMLLTVSAAYIGLTAAYVVYAFFTEDN